MCAHLNANTWPSWTSILYLCSRTCDFVGFRMRAIIESKYSLRVWAIALLIFSSNKEKAAQIRKLLFRRSLSVAIYRPISFLMTCWFSMFYCVVFIITHICMDIETLHDNLQVYWLNILNLPDTFSSVLRSERKRNICSKIYLKNQLGKLIFNYCVKFYFYRYYFISIFYEISEKH